MFSRDEIAIIFVAAAILAVELNIAVGFTGAFEQRPVAVERAQRIQQLFKFSVEN